MSLDSHLDFCLDAISKHIAPTPTYAPEPSDEEKLAAVERRVAEARGRAKYDAELTRLEARAAAGEIGATAMVAIHKAQGRP